MRLTMETRRVSVVAKKNKEASRDEKGSSRKTKARRPQVRTLSTLERTIIAATTMFLV